MNERHKPIARATFGANSIGMCQNQQSTGSAFVAFSKCLSSHSSDQWQLSPAAIAARATALADLRAARTALRYLKKCWLEHYDPSELSAVCDLSHSIGRGHPQFTLPSSVQASSLLRRAFRRLASYPQFLEAETANIIELSATLRRRLIHEGFADSTMVDDQMAYDLGL